MYFAVVADPAVFTQRHTAVFTRRIQRKKRLIQAVQVFQIDVALAPDTDITCIGIAEWSIATVVIAV